MLIFLRKVLVIREMDLAELCLNWDLGEGGQDLVVGALWASHPANKAKMEIVHKIQGDTAPLPPPSPPEIMDTLKEITVTAVSDESVNFEIFRFKFAS